MRKITLSMATSQHCKIETHQLPRVPTRMNNNLAADTRAIQRAIDSRMDASPRSSRDTCTATANTDQNATTICTSTRSIQQHTIQTRESFNGFRSSLIDRRPLETVVSCRGVCHGSNPPPTHNAAKATNNHMQCGKGRRRSNHIKCRRSNGFSLFIKRGAANHRANRTALHQPQRATRPTVSKLTTH